MERTVQRGTETEGDARLHLRGNRGRIDGGAAVDGTHHAMDSDASLLHGNLRHLSGETAERVVYGDTARASGRQRVAPTALLRRQVQHAEVARMILQQ